MGLGGAQLSVIRALRAGGGRWLVPTEFACNRALAALPPPTLPPHATFLVQGSLDRRDMKQLWTLLRRTPAHLNFTIKVSNPHSASNVVRAVLTLLWLTA